MVFEINLTTGVDHSNGGGMKLLLFMRSLFRELIVSKAVGAYLGILQDVNLLTRQKTNQIYIHTIINISRILKMASSMFAIKPYHGE